MFADYLAVRQAAKEQAHRDAIKIDFVKKPPLNAYLGIFDLYEIDTLKKALLVSKE